MRVVLTGAGGFLGWHTRLRLAALTDHDVLPVTRENWSQLGELVADADAVIHVAGVNRAENDDEVERGNSRLAVDVASAISAAGKPLRVVMSGTIQVDRDSAYGRGKRAAQSTIASATTAAGGHFVDVCLPNLFGEHGRPHYNSFVATFVHSTISGQAPQINDNQVELLHVQAAAQSLLDGLDTTETRIRPVGTQTRVVAVWDLLQEFHQSYVPLGEFPDLSSAFRIDLFNAYRAGLFPEHYPIALTPHSDSRGSFVETVRCRGGEGQSSFSTTVPGITRGDHYHLVKIERFAVIQGQARISLRRMFHDEVLDFDVTGDRPVAIDMPVGWVHNITNTGSDTLLTQFWSHELFRPEAPDTFPEPVLLTSVEDAR
ncbi:MULTISPECIES: NAD-dependent epimerase/dehydratase family protein [unclassified Dietzia]|uniref:polysaccharide biosynthesis C-terminal domain-containing protein n=1 Tax=unclassified Dietzia TaxID=2617939 RepID=UPI000D21CE12|nr:MULTISPECIES: NAD-dependent epimerase/dehydratase family protein [unclassified Dietzia]AVZ40295.1 capsule biosynthesis protein CapF [Dietzia sp. JS16-p6b]QGW25773.1 nucleoside-diphosphate-sugar epimerase [Dietzia sp. DQ12-45-1b]